jgi:2-deoxy-D-gluconate 3-dehydrogenase
VKLFSLSGRAALVTGGNGGLGQAIARALSAAGAEVAVTGRDAEKNRAAAKEFPVLRLDVRDERAVARVVARVVARFGRLDILVNNAGVFRGGACVDIDAEGWNEVLDTNLKGAFLCAKHTARAMMHAGRGGKIINVGSMFSALGNRASVSYTASKTGIVGLTRALAVELGRFSIQVNAILPGWYPTAMCPGLSTQPYGRAIRRQTPARRIGRPDDLAGAAIFFASAASDFVTGTALPVDGGYLISDGR